MKVHAGSRVVKGRRSRASILVYGGFDGGFREMLEWNAIQTALSLAF